MKRESEMLKERDYYEAKLLFFSTLGLVLIVALCVGAFLI